MFEVSRAWARGLKQRRRETGETAARPMGGATIIKIDRARLAELVQEQPDATLDELRTGLGVACSLSAVCMALKELGLSYKKRRSTRASRTGRTSPSVAKTGVQIKRRSTSRGWSSSTRRGPRPT